MADYQELLDDIVIDPDTCASLGLDQGALEQLVAQWRQLAAAGAAAKAGGSSSRRQLTGGS
jgi:hypothetical protein